MTIRTLLWAFIAMALAYALTQSLYLFSTPTFSTQFTPKSPVTLDQGPSAMLRIEKINIKSIEKTDAIKNWKLSGTVLGSEPRAMLSSGSDFTILFVGGKLEEYTLKAIEKERAQFSSNDKETWLYMHQKDIGKVESAPKQEVVNAGVDERNLNQTIFNRMMTNPEALMTTVNIVPQMEGGSFNGFKIVGLTPGSDFQKFSGFEKDDVITGINGQPIKSTADALQQYQKMLSMKQFSVTVRRNNQERTIRYDIR